MVKIGIIGHKEVPSYNGGIEAVLTEMIPLMDSDSFEITIYNRWTTFYKVSEWFKKESYSNCKIVKIPTFKKSFLNAFLYSFFASIHAMFNNFDIVHYHAEGPSAMSFLPKATGKKIVITNHGLDWARGKWGGFATKYLKFGEKMSTKTANTLIVLSDPIAKYFEEEYGKETEKIANGINVNERKKANLIKEKFGLDVGSYYLAVGRLVEEKGFHYLIDAYNQLDTDKKLVIAGELTETEHCKRLQEMGANNSNIIFADFVDGELKQELFSNCFAYVIPSDLEGMSISLLESLSYGCRVIASDIEDNKNICDQHITFFKQGDIEDLKAVLMKIRPTTEKEKSTQIDFIKKNYNWQIAVDKTELIYRKVLDDGIEENL